MGYGLLFYLLLVFPFWVSSAPIPAIGILAVWFIVWIAQPKPEKTSEKPQSKLASKGFLSDSGLHDLLLLRLELGRLKQEGKLEPARHEALCEKIDQLWAFHLTRLGVNPQDEAWNERRQVAWSVLQGFSGLPLGLPPWRLETDHKIMLEAEEASPSSTAATPTHPVATGQTEPLASAAPAPAANTPRIAQPPKPPHPREHHPFKPAEPSALELALKAFSGWASWLVPFLVQNIGWFIGGFCFVAGSIFLVAYTGGFAKAFVVFAVLLSYSILLLWGGWHIRRNRPELALSSGALITLSLLLVPLNLAAAMRMVLVADAPGLLALALLTTAAYAYACHWAVMLASGMMDRSLQGGHPRLFLSLAAIQISVPVLHHWPLWPLLALVHLILLGLLGYALRQFTHDWLHSIFIDRRKVAYYAAGTLVYAALVSFFHTTWGVDDIVLPTGYAGPFLMALAGLLFAVDAEFKQWSERHAYLSHFSFALYGLSALALAVAYGSFGPMLVTLLLGLGLYASIAWRYLTYPPLVLFLVCASWGYALLVLRYFDPPWHLLLSLPGLFGLQVLARTRLLGRSATLAELTSLSLGLLLVVLLGWSLAHSQPGWIALATVLATMALVWGMKQVLPTEWSETLGTLEDLRIYSLSFLWALALAYAPLVPGVTWAVQFGFGLMALAAVWTWLGLSNLRDTDLAERWLNAALLALLLALGLAATLWPSATPAMKALLLVFAAGVLGWQSLGLYVRSLFYAALLALGLAGAIVKLTYFPAPSTGFGSLMLALGLCVLSWWLELRSAEIGEWRRQNLALWGSRRPSLLLLGSLRTGGDEIFSAGELLCLPLRQVAALLWLIGLLAWLNRLAIGQTGWGWVLAALAGMVAALPLAGYFRISHWPPVLILLGLAGLLGALDAIGLDANGLPSMAAMIYAGLAWRLSVTLIAHPLSSKLAAWFSLDLGFDHLEEQRSLEQDAHYTAFAVNLTALAILLQSPMSISPVIMAASLLAGAIFFLNAGWRYRSVVHSYLVLALVMLAVGLVYLLNFQAEGLSLARLGGTGAMWLAALALAFFGLARYLSIGLVAPDDGFDESLYRKPLQVNGLLLAWVGAILSLVRVAALAMQPDLTAIITLALADLALLLNNRRLGYQGLELLGVLLAVLNALWLALFLRHGVEPFDPWNDPHGDVWIILALLSLGLAWLGYWLRESGKTIDLAFRCLALLLGIRILLPLALVAVPVFLGEPQAAEGFSLHSVWLPVLLGLALPASASFGRSALTHESIAIWASAVVSLYLALGVELFHPPLFFALACAGLLAANWGLMRWKNSVPLTKTLEAWALACLWISLVLMFRFFLNAPVETLWTLGLVVGLTAYLAHQRQSLGLVFVDVALVVLLLHSWLWVWLKPSSMLGLLPWYSLQWAVVLVVWPWLWQYQDGERRSDGWRGDVQRCSAICRDGLVALLVGEWALHLLVFTLDLQSSAPAMDGLAHAAALLAGGILLGLEIRRLKGHYESGWVYPLSILFFALLVYVRLLCLGLSEPGLWDTAGFVALTFLFSILQQWSNSTPLRRISTGLPLLILLTVHWELASTSATLNLLVVAGLYLWISRTQGRLPAYLALLLFNIAVYLWIPHWSKQADLLQIYVVPAAGSVLLMLHLHKRELKPETLNAARLASTSLLYACATLDVFLRPGFGVFLLALGLSLASVAVGIALRVRAFVYSGLGFLVLNIAGQLGHLYPEGRLARAVVLMGIGSLVTVSMIFFQLKREEVMRRIRIVRADLARWE